VPVPIYTAWRSHTSLRAIEADLKPLNISLSWKKATVWYNWQWQSFVDSATLTKHTTPEKNRTKHAHLRSRKSKKSFFQNAIFAVPQRQCKTQLSVVITDAK